MTAEFAMVVPAVILLLALCLSAMQLSSRQLRLQDAAADAARVIARGDDPGSAAHRAVSLVPGATLDTHTRGDLVCVRLRAPAAVAGGLFGAVSLAASSCALASGH